MKPRRYRYGGNSKQRRVRLRARQREIGHMAGKLAKAIEDALSGAPLERVIVLPGEIRKVTITGTVSV